MSNKDENSSPKSLPPWNVSALLAVAWPLGILPKAPGTFGSLAGIPLAYVLQILSWQAKDYAWIVILSGLFLFGIFSLWIIQRTESYWNTHDDGRIVIDEVLGQAIVLSFFPLDLFHIVTGFVLFRIFDIWKPSLVGWADKKLPGAYGTLLDDVFAGLFALAILGFLSRFAGNIL